MEYKYLIQYRYTIVGETMFTSTVKCLSHEITVEDIIRIETEIDYPFAKVLSFSRLSMGKENEDKSDKRIMAFVLYNIVSRKDEIVYTDLDSVVSYNPLISQSVICIRDDKDDKVYEYLTSISSVWIGGYDEIASALKAFCNSYDINFVGKLSFNAPSWTKVQK